MVPEAGGARGDNTQGTKEKHIFHQKMLKSIFLNISLNSSQGGLGGWSRGGQGGRVQGWGGSDLAYVGPFLFVS